MTRRTKRRLGVVTALVAAGVAALVGPAVVGRWQAERRYAAVVARLDADDPHWRLTDREAHRYSTPAPGDAEDFGGAVADAHAALGGLNTLDTAWRTRRDEMLRELVPNVRLAPGQWRCAVDGVEAHEDAIRPALALAHFTRGRTDDGPDLVGRMWHVHDWVLEPLRLSAVQRGDVATALGATRATLNLARSLRDGPPNFATVARVNYRIAAVRGLERLLGHAELTDAQLAAVRDDLLAALTDDPWPGAVRGELATLDYNLAMIRGRKLTPSQIASRYGPQAVRNVPWRQAADWLRDRAGANVVAEHAELLEIAADAVATALRPWPERWAAVQALPRRYDMTRPELVRWLTPDYARTFAYFAYDEARARCALAAVAAERHRLARGDWPASLAELGPLPDDPFTGKPLGYVRFTDGIVVYCVAFDRADDGGTLAAYEFDSTLRPGTDVGFRVWDVPRRNQRPAGGEP